jgi:Ca2+-binding RTX toxin-like protein
MRQGELRGWPVSEADNQRASDLIAGHFINEMVLANSEIPDVMEIFRFEPNGAKLLYESYPDDNDTAKQEGASWVGAFLVSPFGFDMTDLLLTQGVSETDMDCMDDLKNVLFAYDAFQEALLSAFSEMDMTWSSSVNALLAGMSVPEVERLYGLVTEVGPEWSDDNIANFMRGRTAAETFELIRNLGKNDTLDHLMSAWLGRRTNNTTDETFVATACEFFQSIAGNVQRTTGLERLDDKSVDELVALALTDAKYRNALRGLSTFALDLTAEQYAQRHLQLFDPMTGQGDMTLNYLNDRAAALEMFLQYDSSSQTDHFFDAIDFPSWTWGDARIVDRASGEQLTVDGWDLGIADTRYLMFGGDGADELTGGTEEDRLYGGAGNDNIDGGEENDYLEGNAGADRLGGGEGNDELHGGAGNDSGGDRGLYGGAGDDALYGEAGNDTLDGGTERDLLVGGLGQDHLIGGDGIDNLYGDNRYFDEETNQYMLVDDGISDRLEGGLGDDLYFAGAGDVINDVDGLGTVCVNLTTGYGDQVYVMLGLNTIRQMDDPNVYEEYNPYYDTTIRYALNGANLTINDSITIENFRDADLGINIGAEYNTPLWRDPQHISYWFDMYRNHEYTDSYNVWWPPATNLFADAVMMVPRFFPITWDTTQEGATNVLRGTDEDDLLTGNEQDDFAHGGRGDDILSGEGGDDWLSGDEGSDTLDGGDGDDLLFGGEGDDNLDGGPGADRLFGGTGNDLLRGSEGDIVRGGEGNDRYLYAVGDGDIYIANCDYSDLEGLDVLEFLEGIDPTEVSISRLDEDLLLSIESSGEVITIGGFFYAVENGMGVDNIEFANGTVWDQTTIMGRIRQAGDDDDVMMGTEGADTLDGRAGDDVLHGREGDDLLSGGDGNDRIFGDSGDDQLQGGDGNDTLRGNHGNDQLEGGDGNDELWGQAGDDTLNGGEGNDDLFGGAGNDTLECGTGYCVGEAGDDTYVHIAGDGDVTISNSDPDGAGNDRLVLRGVNSADVRLTLFPDFDDINLHISYTYGSRGERVTVTGFFNQDGTTGQSIDGIVFDDGVSWDFDDIMSEVRRPTDGYDMLYAYSNGDILHGLGGNDNLYGGAGDDQLYGDEGRDAVEGGAGDDTLIGGEGGDRLEGGEGSDLFLFNLGDGNDRIRDGAGIRENEVDTLRFGEGLARDDVSFRPVPIGFFEPITPPDYPADVLGSSLLIESKVSNDSVCLSGYFYNLMYPGSDSQVSNNFGIEFSEGTRITQNELYDFFTQPTDQDDYYLCTEGTESVHLQDGSDRALGNIGDDVLFGDDGSDILYGDRGSDELDGGNGNDVVRGQDGNDRLTGGNGDDELYGGLGDDILRGGPGHDYLNGSNGNDVYLFDAGDGSCTIENSDNSAYSNDVVRFLEGVAVEDVVLSRQERDLIIELGDDGDRITVTNNFLDDNLGSHELDAIEFADGTVWDARFIQRTVLQPSMGDDLLFADPSGSVLDGLGGDDRLMGAEGNDRLSGGSGDDALFGNDGNDRLSGDAGNDSLDGGYGEDVIFGGGGDDDIHGGQGNDIISGDMGEDYLAGEQGDDVLIATAGTNTLIGGEGNDTYLLGLETGDNTIINFSIGYENPFDRILFDEGITPDMVTLSRSDLQLIIEYAGSVTRVENYFRPSQLSRTTTIDTIEFQDGTHWNYSDVLAMLLEGDATDQILTGYDTDDLINGMAGNDQINGMGGDDKLFGGAGDDYLVGAGGSDQLYGGAGNDELYGSTFNDRSDDILIGGIGNDRLEGGPGNDIYRFRSGDGQDTIDDRYGYNKIEFVNLSSTQIEISRSGDDMILRDLEGGGQITVVDQYADIPSPAYVNTIQELHFSDGVVVLDQVIRGGSDNDVLDGTPESDGIEALAGNDEVFANDGDDYVNGGTGNDQLFGEAGDDRLEGGRDNDELNGGTGQDYLSGSEGDDVYRFQRGDGQDTIDDQIGHNIIEFTDLNATHIDVNRSGDDLLITDLDGRGQIRVINQYDDGGGFTGINSIFRINFSDGTTWNIVDIREHLRQSDIIDSTGREEPIEAGGSILLNNQVDQLVAAMAAYDVPAGVGYVIPQEVRSELQPVLAENWQAIA